MDADLACVVLTVMPQDSDAIEVLLNPASAIDMILKTIAALTKLEQGDEP